MQRRVWEGIAASWNRRRQKPEMRVSAFMRGKKLLLDVGCGSGRHFLRGKSYVGVDFSKSMLRLAAQNAKRKGAKAHLICADASALPFRDGSFGSAVMAAVLHVVPKRRKALRELKRVLRRNGRALVTVWNKKQPRFAAKGKVAYVPWRTGKQSYRRYYYLFEKNELKKLLGEYFTVSSVKEHGQNIVALVKK